jgi:hypothetical protein
MNFGKRITGKRIKNLLRGFQFRLPVILKIVLGLSIRLLKIRLQQVGGTGSRRKGRGAGKGIKIHPYRMLAFTPSESVSFMLPVR